MEIVLGCFLAPPAPKSAPNIGTYILTAAGCRGRWKFCMESVLGHFLALPAPKRAPNIGTSRVTAAGCWGWLGVGTPGRLAAEQRQRQRQSLPAHMERGTSGLLEGVGGWEIFVPQGAPQRGDPQQQPCSQTIPHTDRRAPQEEGDPQK